MCDGGILELARNDEWAKAVGGPRRVEARQDLNVESLQALGRGRRGVRGDAVPPTAPLRASNSPSMRMARFIATTDIGRSGRTRLPRTGEACAPNAFRTTGSAIVLNHAMTLTVVNPATEAPIAELEQAGVEETDRAVARARSAFPGWRAVAPADRARLLRRLATLIEEQHEALSQLESANAGKPISGARGEIGMVAQVFHFYAGAVDKHYGETIPVAGGIDVTFREPLGVVGLITPWNFPLNIASWKVGPALATGNTIVIKPAG